MPNASFVPAQRYAAAPPERSASFGNPLACSVGKGDLSYASNSRHIQMLHKLLMPELMYLLVQKSANVYCIRQTQTITYSISQVQELLYHASEAACELLDSASAVTINAYVSVRLPLTCHMPLTLSTSLMLTRHTITPPIALLSEHADPSCVALFGL
ncbi:hypothetical protein BKA82DRAFT_31467 [Pisolithus tinctorius]|uniref:Uncharacterized protein n=1 Tax=Pisolithus tinctorius Marx 270 TaxID=870435 RepID=A0A0C3NB27_PISTI|nr:hypothetical protein BKA82DRAFT_31467 [Pisolithus tinctorius]KIN98289.1 hypothetical protein M404DRAFT_31467 [Pisolithus tinctorius Marx 270]